MPQPKEPRVSTKDDPALQQERPKIGERLRISRKAAGHTLESAAAALTERGYRIGKAGVGHWETGVNMPDVHALRRLARLYDTTIDALLGETPLSPDAVRMAKQYDMLDVAERERLRAVWDTMISTAERAFRMRREQITADAQGVIPPPPMADESQAVSYSISAEELQQREGMPAMPPRRVGHSKPPAPRGAVRVPPSKTGSSSRKRPG